MNVGPKITYRETARTADTQDAEEVIISVQTANGLYILIKM
jgi:hypothetical protein